MDDHALRCTLTFERSPSPYYREALRLARATPGYESNGDGPQMRNVVPITVAAMPVAERLLRDRLRLARIRCRRGRRRPLRGRDAPVARHALLLPPP